MSGTVRSVPRLSIGALLIDSIGFLKGCVPEEAIVCHNAIILIVEDEALVALDLAMAVEAAGGIVVGPATTTAEALALVADARSRNKPIHAALLDGNLADRDVTPVVLHLYDYGVPMVVYSATGLPAEVAGLSTSIPWVQKPASTDRVVAVLTDKLASMRTPA